METERIRGRYMNQSDLEHMVERGNEERKKMKTLALELVRTAAEQGVSVRDFLSVLKMAEEIAMKGKLNPPGVHQAEFQVFTQKDFLSAKPYEHLFKMKNDPLQHEKAFEAVQKNAHAVGIKNFSRLYEEYLVSRQV